MSESKSESFRIERDSMGEMKIPSDLLYGASTQRAVENFPISKLRFGRLFIRTLAQIKSCCASANKKLGKLDGKIADAIVAASQTISEGQYDAHFVVDIFQTGSGTSTNMNFNEVAANLANTKLGSKVGSKSPVHPNDHVNMGQSSNDIIPTAIHVAAAVALNKHLLPELKDLENTLHKKAQEFENIIKTGRTHLQDATPLSLGQEFSGYAAQVTKSCARIERCLPSLCELPVGGTAVGTGINTHPEFAKIVCEDLSKNLSIPFVEASNHFEAQAAKDACVEASGALKTVAISLTKVANDIRWLACGPRAGLGELILPSVQPGSSIMPGKVNPVIPEALIQVCAQVIGNDLTVSLSGMGSYFELNVMMPVLAHNLLESIEILTSATRVFNQKCVKDLQANKSRIEQTVEQGLMLATALAPAVGYDKAADLAKKAYAENKTIRQVAKEHTKLSDSEIANLLDPKKMIHPDSA